MFYCNLLSISCTDAWRNMNELTSDVTFFTNLLLCEECFSWEADLLLLLNVANNKNWVGVIPSNDFIDVNIVLHQLRSCRVPSHNSLFSVDTTHHVEHLFVIDVIEKPNIRFLEILLEWNCIAISYVQYFIISVLSSQHSNNSLRCSACNSVVVIDDGQ